MILLITLIDIDLLNASKRMSDYSFALLSLWFYALIDLFIFFWSKSNELREIDFMWLIVLLTD